MIRCTLVGCPLIPKRGTFHPASSECMLFIGHIFRILVGQTEVVSKVIDPVILNLLQDLNALYIRSRNKFGMTRSTIILTFETVSWGWGNSKFYS
jgi:hypothetical protein